jgi:hypothetical protein
MASTALQSTEKQAAAQPLAREISAAVCRHVETQVHQFETSPENCLEKVNQATELQTKRALGCEPSQFTWMDFHTLNQTDPELGLQRWNEVQEAAKQQFLSGHMAAAANEGTLSATAWPRAQFLALREELARDWNPQNGIEWSLIDMMAQAYSAQLFWQERLMSYSCLEADNKQIKKNDRYRLPRVSDAQAQDQAAQMADRFNRIYMRSLRALRDLRRHAPTLVVHNAAQVNVAENQLNVEVT